MELEKQFFLFHVLISFHNVFWLLQLLYIYILYVLKYARNGVMREIYYYYYIIIVLDLNRIFGNKDPLPL